MCTTAFITFLHDGGLELVVEKRSVFWTAAAGHTARTEQLDDTNETAPPHSFFPPSYTRHSKRSYQAPRVDIKQSEKRFYNIHIYIHTYVFIVER